MTGGFGRFIIRGDCLRRPVDVASSGHDKVAVGFVLFREVGALDVLLFVEGHLVSRTAFDVIFFADVVQHVFLYIPFFTGLELETAWFYCRVFVHSREAVLIPQAFLRTLAF